MGRITGGLALAMALSVPTGVAMISGSEGNIDVRDIILLMTYSVVTFSILVQASTIKPMIQKAKLVDPRRVAFNKLGGADDFMPHI